jgi:hypothetical protein
MKIFIYKIVHLTKPELIYIGSTSNFNMRRSQHKIKSKDADPKIKLYKSIQENGGWDQFKCEVVEEIEINNREEGRIRENKFIEELNAVLNNNRAYITKEQAKEAVKEYYNAHRDELILKKKSKIACECGCLLSRSNPYTHRQTKKHLRLLTQINPA